MVSTQRIRGRFLSQLDDFDQDVITGVAANRKRQNVVVDNCPADHEFTVNSNFRNHLTYEISFQTLEKLPSG